MMVRTLLTAATLALVFATHSFGSITVETWGTDAPKSTLGTFTMTPFGVDVSTLGSNVSSVGAPGGGAITFSKSLQVWSADSDLDFDYSLSDWSGGSNIAYLGNAYFLRPGNSVTITLPGYSKAFYFYALPNMENLDIVVTTNGGSLGTNQYVYTPDLKHAGGAAGFGFYSNSNDVSEFITSIQYCPVISRIVTTV